MPDSTAKPALSAAQWLALAGCFIVTAYGVIGLFVNPDFAIGDATTSELVLGVDMNGWHAVSGFLIVIPVLLVLRNEELFPWVMAAATVGLYGTAFWAVFSEYPALGLFYFPNPTGDAVLHLVTGTIFFAGTVLAFASQRRAAA